MVLDFLECQQCGNFDRMQSDTAGARLWGWTDVECYGAVSWNMEEHQSVDDGSCLHFFLLSGSADIRKKEQKNRISISAFLTAAYLLELFKGG